ncbi:N-acetylglucosamine-6-phosphate deacetylase [Paenibacillus filicis]|uniref:N-acetylglucosamine-6-phosphate deacetylase n=1 Tax=Paenibacillus gyeongsangnamensis TaxID=3388067 RepID=A0ABT4Q9C6_9BACL|nr:N-acetylglucosamine-6-phosphate deacetylase [Paenibacillus filicis]MCZ8513480.1 N-acetylglucosamine-6-phosphate deacetylase [Paenibacillus filicis]
MSGASEIYPTLIRNAAVVTPDGIIPQGYALINEQGRLASVGTMEGQGSLPSVERSVDACGGWLLPGFIDVHVHGGFGHDFMDAGAAELDAITRFHAAHGTTTMLATTVTASQAAISGVLSRVSAYRQQVMPFATLAGVHLEGPFISPQWPGAQNPNFIEPPRKDWLEAWHTQYPGLIRMLTLAPERDGAPELIEWLTRSGIVASCGHTDASYEQLTAARKHGLRHAVHTFNAMTGLHHRKPGVVGAVLDHDDVSAEIIADGHHVHPAAIRLLTRVKRQDNLLLITDAISAAGLGDGEYSLGGLDVMVKDGVARLRDGDNLAGSTLTMLGALRFMVEKVGIDLAAASRMASWNPAKLLGLAQTTGSIEAGKQADLLQLTPALELERVWIRGREPQLGL